MTQPYLFKCTLSDDRDESLGDVYVRAPGNHPLNDVRAAAFDLYAEFVRYNIGHISADKAEDILFRIAKINVVGASPILSQ